MKNRCIYLREANNITSINAMAAAADQMPTIWLSSIAPTKTNSRSPFDPSHPLRPQKKR